MSLFTHIAAENLENIPSDWVNQSEKSIENIKVTTTIIHKDSTFAHKGTYINFNIPPFELNGESENKYLRIASLCLGQLLPKTGLILVAGIGNIHITADSLGPLCGEKIFSTNSLIDFQKDNPLNLRPVACIIPGVEGRTGIDTKETLKTTAKNLKASCIICIDSLCTLSADKLGSCVQINNSGLSLEFDINKRLCQESLGVPVIAIGIPTVLSTAKLTEKTIPLMVCPKEIDTIIKRGTNIISKGVNLALQKSLSLGEIEYLTQ